MIRKIVDELNSSFKYGAYFGFVSLACIALFSACSGSMLTPKDETDLSAYAAQMNACIVAHAPDKVAIDACRAQVKAAFDAVHPSSPWAGSAAVK